MKITPPMAKAAFEAMKYALRQQQARDGNAKPIPAVLDMMITLGLIVNSGQPATVDGFPGVGFPDETSVDAAVETVRPSTEIDVRTAAERLGISVQAVRKRCTTGTLAGRKVGGVWLIEMENAQ